MSDFPVKGARLILGDQLNSKHSWFNSVDESIIYIMMEVRSETDYIKHHIQKVVGIFSAMRKFYQDLENQGHRFHYFRLNDEENRQDFAKNIESLIAQNPNLDWLEYQEPDEYRLDQLLKTSLAQLPLNVSMVSSEHFLTKRTELEEFFGQRNFLTENFYRQMRKKWNILMNGSEPEAGKWNFDASNRKKLPKGHIPPPPFVFSHNVEETLADIQSAGVKTIGTIDPQLFEWPLDREEALQLFDYFCVHLLPLFGDFQDSMTPGGWSLYHSRISFALNTKMIHPLEVIQRVEKEWRLRSNEIDISQAEGFIRQILGWREYVRGIYWSKMPEYAEKNFFDHQQKLPSWFWTGETKMACLKDAIGQSLNKAYAHHIQRLMLTGNFALLMGIHPDEIDAWYLGIYIDAFEWVEMPNTRGMSQFADGGIMATKPYVSSANYINKMSDYCKGCYYDPKVKTGAKACPFNALYWDFFDRHEEKLRRNPRIGMAYRNLDKMNPELKAEIFEHASWIHQNLEKL